jgi:holo-[acyl-carrier protein] synthase
VILGLGTDIVEVVRIGRLIERHADHFLARVFTVAEIADCQRRRDFLQHYAARWSAKQAVARALQFPRGRAHSWRDLELTLLPTGEVAVQLRGGWRDHAEQQEVTNLQVTFAYCRTYATATALALGRSDPD